MVSKPNSQKAMLGKYIQVAEDFRESIFLIELLQ